MFETGYNWSLTADRRAYRVGDILTVILEESTQSSKQAKTNFGTRQYLVAKLTDMITNGTPDFALLEEYTGIEPIDHAELTKD